MKLISYNIALFEKNNNELAQFLKKQNADILCLQEVTKRLDQSSNLDYISMDSIDLASENLVNSFFAPTWVLSNYEKFNFHGHDHFEFNLGGKVEFGNYIKTKFPITKGQNVFVQGHFTYITDWSNWPDEDYRVVQVVDIIVEKKPLRLLNYHGIWSKDKHGNDKTKKACEIIRDLALEVNYPAIICGDFNLFPDTESINVLNKEFESLVDTFNIKTSRPSSNELSDKKRNVVDFMFVSKGIKVNNFEVIDTNISDHLPLILNFEI